MSDGTDNVAFNFCSVKTKHKIKIKFEGKISGKQRKLNSVPMIVTFVNKLESLVPLTFSVNLFLAAKCLTNVQFVAIDYFKLPVTANCPSLHMWTSVSVSMWPDNLCINCPPGGMRHAPCGSSVELVDLCACANSDVRFYRTEMCLKEPCSETCLRKTFHSKITCFLWRCTQVIYAFLTVYLFYMR